MPLILTPPGSRQGYTLTTLVSNVTSILTADREYLVREIRFQLAAGLTATTTVRIHAEGQDLFGGQAVPVIMLNSAWSANNQASAGTGTGSIFRPDSPIAWSESFPLKFTSADTLTVITLADMVIPPAVPG